MVTSFSKRANLSLVYSSESQENLEKISASMWGKVKEFEAQLKNGVLIKSCMKLVLILQFHDRQTDRQTDRKTDR